MLNALQQRILETLETLNILREAPGYELHLALKTAHSLPPPWPSTKPHWKQKYMAQLEAEAARLAEEIEGLTGVAPADE